MNYTIILENQLKAINSGNFQRLCSELLEKMYDLDKFSMSKIGIQLGTNKSVKGTPDTLLTTMDGKHVYVEYGSSIDVVNKLEDDYAKCLKDMNEKGVTMSEFVFFTNRRIDLTDPKVSAVISSTMAYKIELRIIQLDDLVAGLKRFPSLAREYLSININTNILDINEFLHRNNNSAVKMKHDGNFLHREDILEKLLGIEKHSKFLILSGQPGCGKTRLSIEYCKELEKREHFEVIVLDQINTELVKELGEYCYDSSKKYMLFLDDINNFSGISELIKYMDANSNIFMIATVRGYAKKIVLNKIMPHEPNIIDLQNISIENINRILKENFGINNNECLSKINNIYGDNLRFSIMAAEVALKENNMNVLHNSYEMMNKYFSTHKELLKRENYDNDIKVLGIISVFDKFDKQDVVLIEKFCELLNLTLEEFEESLVNLVKEELIEIHFDNYVKMSDQILATYIIYRVFILEQNISMKSLIREFMFNYENKIVSTINSILFAFTEKTKGILETIIKELWIEFEIREESEKIRFYNIFHLFNPTKYLIFANKSIESFAKKEVNIDISFFQSNSHAFEYDKSLSDIARSLGNIDVDNETTIQLLLDLFDKDPYQISNISEIIKNFSVTGTLISDFNKLKKFFEKNFQLSDNFRNHNFSMLFFKMSSIFVTYSINVNKLENQKTFIYTDVALPDNSNVKKVKELIWKGISKCYEKNIFIKEVNFIIEKFISQYIVNANQDLINYDKQIIIDKLLECDFFNTVYGKYFLTRYSKYILKNDETIHQSISINKLLQYEFLCDFVFKRCYEDKPYSRRGNKDFYEKYLRLDDTLELSIEVIQKLQLELLSDRQYVVGELQTLIIDTIIIYGEKGDLDFLLKRFINLNIQLSIGNISSIVHFYSENASLESVLKLPHHVCQSIIWKLYAYSAAKEEDLSEEGLIDLLSSIEKDKVVHNTYAYINITKLVNFEKIREGSYIEILDAIYLKAKGGSWLYEELLKEIFSRKKEEISVELEKYHPHYRKYYLFFINKKNNVNEFDYDYIYFLFFYEKNKDFLDEYLNTYDKNYMNINFEFIWRLEDSVAVWNKIMHLQIEKRKYSLSFYPQHNKFIDSSEENREKVLECISYFIQQNLNSPSNINYLLDIMNDYNNELKKHIIDLCFNHVKNNTILEQIEFIKPPTFWSGSLIPYLKNMKELANYIINKLSGKDSLSFKNKLEESLRKIDEEIKKETIREFNADF